MDYFFSPYINSKTTKRFSYKKPGVYIIRHKITHNITYIGMSKSNAYKAMYRHFQNWTDNTCRRVVYHDRNLYEVRIIFVNVVLCDYVERRLIKYFKPEDNFMLYEGENDIIKPELTKEDEFWLTKENITVPF